MLGLYAFKQLVVKTKLTTTLALKITEIVNFVFLNIIRWMRFNFNKSVVALKGKLELRAHKNAIKYILGIFNTY